MKIARGDETLGRPPGDKPATARVDFKSEALRCHLPRVSNLFKDTT